jgi:CBS domain-containing protein
MTTDLATVGPGTSLADLIALLGARRISAVPVLRDGALVGIIRRANLIEALALPHRQERSVASDVAARQAIIAWHTRSAAGAPRGNTGRSWSQPRIRREWPRCGSV